MSRNEWIVLIVTVFFGLVGAVLYETLGDLGEMIGLCLPIPPALLYLAFMPNNETTNQTKNPRWGNSLGRPE